jgi:hypothetical protein
MRFASNELTRVQICGGAWNGIGVDGFLYEPETYATLDRFIESVEWAVDTHPLVQYNPSNDQLIGTDNGADVADEPDRIVLQMRVPDRETLVQWYESHLVAQA